MSNEWADPTVPDGYSTPHDFYGWIMSRHDGYFHTDVLSEFLIERFTDEEPTLHTCLRSIEDDIDSYIDDDEWREGLKLLARRAWVEYRIFLQYNG